MNPDYLRSFVAGLVIAPGWGNIFLGSVLLVVAVNGNIVSNTFNLLAYSLEFSAMLIATVIFAAPLRLLFKKLGGLMGRIQQIGGGLIVFVGVLMVTNNLGWISGLGTWSGGGIVRSFLGLE